MFENKWLVVGVSATAAFLGYCVYFDRKRRLDPDYKKKVLARRKAARFGHGSSSSSSSAPPLPNTNNPAEMQRYFLTNVQKGEELLATGDIDGGIDHLSSAIAVCGQPQQLLHVLQQTLPPQVFQLLLQRLPMVSQRIAAASAGPPMGGMMGSLAEDDLE